ncbi:DUF4021 family protein [Bacillus cereus group sp. N28]|nr:DUF4021 family protein [Bacillus cereus group sp. N28]
MKLHFNSLLKFYFYFRRLTFLFSPHLFTPYSLNLILSFLFNYITSAEIRSHISGNLNIEEQAMNGLYGMPETTIEDADHVVTDDLTSKN